MSLRQPDAARSRHTPQSTSKAWQAALLVLGSWPARAATVFVLLETFGFRDPFHSTVLLASRRHAR